MNIFHCTGAFPAMIASVAGGNDALTAGPRIIFAWLAVTSVWTFFLFGRDKWQAGRSAGLRTAESSLLLACSLGGWPGGLLAMILFRHKSAKPAFQLKFIVAFLVWTALLVGALRLAARL